jgi:hypothetical protein
MLRAQPTLLAEVATVLKGSAFTNERRVASADALSVRVAGHEQHAHF